MAVKKKGKITKAPSGVSFMYEPREAHGSTPCVVDGCDGEIVHASGTFPTAIGASVFMCTACDWVSPDGYEHEPTPKQFHHVDTTVVKKQKPKKPNVQLRNAVRAEVHKQMKRLIKERAKFPKKLSDKQREHMHTFAVSSEAIREELSNG